MLEKLCVKNFAIIEDLTVEFRQGMTVLTGETGAGKSLIIDTISLLLGARADSDMIRYGQSMARVEGTFSAVPAICSILEKYNIPVEDKVTVLREIYDTSKNVIRVNRHPVSLAVLKNISVFLADIHVQNDTYRLFNPDNYLEILDAKDDAKLDKLMAAYSKHLYTYLEALQRVEHIQSGQKNAMERLEFLRFEQQELEALNLEEDIDIHLEEKITRLENYDKIYSGLAHAYQSLENEMNPIDALYEAAKSLEAVSSYAGEYREYSVKLLDSYYIAAEIKDEVSKQLSMTDYDEAELNTCIERYNEITKAKEKYKKSVSELMDYLKRITLDIEMTTNYDEVLKESLQDCREKYTVLCGDAARLTEYRKQLARALEKGIISECRELDLENIRFEIAFQDVSFTDCLDKSVFSEHGCDRIDFLVSFNKGEPLKMLYKVASGGEMSRMMLAFKSYLSKRASASLMVFDEIDTGVSGATAKKIAQKMHEISRNVQVLCITHLPQVAAVGDYHKHIYKVEDNNRTTTRIMDLDHSQRIEEIALMLSGDKLSLYALEHAKALLEDGKEKGRLE